MPLTPSPPLPCQIYTWPQLLWWSWEATKTMISVELLSTKLKLKQSEQGSSSRYSSWKKRHERKQHQCWGLHGLPCLTHCRRGGVSGHSIHTAHQQCPRSTARDISGTHLNRVPHVCCLGTASHSFQYSCPLMELVSRPAPWNHSIFRIILSLIFVSICLQYIVITFSLEPL